MGTRGAATGTPVSRDSVPGRRQHLGGELTHLPECGIRCSLAFLLQQTFKFQIILDSQKSCEFSAVSPKINVLLDDGPFIKTGELTLKDTAE